MPVASAPALAAFSQCNSICCLFRRAPAWVNGYDNSAQALTLGVNYRF